MENSIEEDINVLKNCWVMTTEHELDKNNMVLKAAIKNTVKDYERLLKENEQLLQKIEKLIEELKQDDINMTRKYKEKKNITGELLGIDKVRVRAYREKTREINEKLHKLLIETKGK